METFAISLVEVVERKAAGIEDLRRGVALAIPSSKTRASALSRLTEILIEKVNKATYGRGGKESTRLFLK